MLATRGVVVACMEVWTVVRGLVLTDVILVSEGSHLIDAYVRGATGTIGKTCQRNVFGIARGVCNSVHRRVLWEQFHYTNQLVTCTSFSDMELRLIRMEP